MHVAAWVVWIAAVITAASTTRNPLYLILLLMITLLVSQASHPAGDGRQARVRPARFALFVVPVSMLVNGLFTHYGETVVLRIPDGLPLLGGPITIEALLYGALNGIILSILLATFSAFASGVPARDLVRLVPRALFPVALVVSISITFLPATLRQAEQIREAQAIRGHRMRRLRDWLPLFMPLLVGGLERSLQLAEAMTARGLAGEGELSERRQRQLLGVLSVVAVAGGIVLWIGWSQPVWGLALVAGGMGLLVWRLWRGGRQTQRTAYRPTPWGARNTVVVLCAVLGMLAYWAFSARGRSYTPYPAVTWPLFEPPAGVGLLGLSAPIFTFSAVGDDRT